MCRLFTIQKLKISIIVLVQFSDIYFCTENISGERERERGVNFWNFGFINASVNLRMFSANQVIITVCHFFYYKFSYTFKFWIFKYSIFFSVNPFVYVCFHLEVPKTRFFFPFLLNFYIPDGRIQMLCMLLNFIFMKILKPAITGLLAKSSFVFYFL